MNREIKFRCWDKEGNNYSGWKPQMIYPETFSEQVETPNCQFPHPYKTSRYEFMQYTGLKDKNGKEIYEGDICRLVPFEDNKHSEHMIGDRQVVWIDYHACFYFADWVPLHWGGFESIEIIGNIYENPELLK